MWNRWKRLLTNSRTPQNPRLPLEPDVKSLRLKQPLPGVFCPFLQEVGYLLPEVQTSQPVSNILRASIFPPHSCHSMSLLMLVANATYEVCSALTVVCNVRLIALDFIESAPRGRNIRGLEDWHREIADKAVTSQSLVTDHAISAAFPDS